MKLLRILFLAGVALCAQHAGLSVEIDSATLRPPSVFDPIYIGASITGLVATEVPTNVRLDVVPGRLYPVHMLVGGILTKIGTVVFDPAGQPTFTPL